ncbi:HNH endonuclease signature motif containing protein [Gordonia sp. AC31]|nr:HNH endonuclease signature motif containing protein [Gordonia sp. AC31]
MTTVEQLAQWSERSRAKFWSRVEKSDGCWLWRGSSTIWGYGQFNHSHPGLTKRAHKLSWESSNGPVPDGLVLDHLCRNRMCVRPDHLEPVTNRENVLRGVGITAQNARRELCVNGHQLDDRRLCSTCQKRKYDRQLARNKELRAATLCGHLTRAGHPCTRRVSLGKRCPLHDSWNTKGTLR